MGAPCPGARPAAEAAFIRVAPITYVLSILRSTQIEISPGNRRTMGNATVERSWLNLFKQVGGNANALQFAHKELGLLFG